MFYDEEELLEAVDILVEEYGYDEDEAIDMINETVKGKLDGVADKAFNKYGELVKDMMDKKEVYDYAKGHMNSVDRDTIDPERYKAMKKSYRKVRNNYAKSTAKVYAPSVAPAVIAGSLYVSHKAYKKYKAKKDLQNKNNRKK